MSPSPPTCPLRIYLISYGHTNGPIVQQQQHTTRERESQYHKALAYNIRHLLNPPRHLRVNATGLSRRLQKEFLRNEHVEGFLVKVQEEVFDAVVVGWNQLSYSSQQEGKEQGLEEGDDCSDSNAHPSKEIVLEDADIDITVTICCEEGRHRSVASVEELARRLAVFKHGDGVSQDWKLDINVMHRDIGEPEHFLGQKKRNKAQAKTRKRERREKGGRYNSSLGDDLNN